MAKSPTASIKSREIIGGDLFSQRREVFGKHDTVFLPTPSSPVYREVDPIVTSNHGITTSNFKRNSPACSSMRETRTDHQDFEVRTRKYSDNFTAELNQSDDNDYRRSMTERTRRLSKLRREFLASNLHEPTESPFARTGVRSSLPARSATPRYKIESPNLYKFPFAEPFTTPSPVRRVFVNMDDTNKSEDVEGRDGEKDKENEDPVTPKKQVDKYKSLPADAIAKVADHQKLFDELVKRYSPQRKQIDWTLPPTKPKVVSTVLKSENDATNTDASVACFENGYFKGSDDVFDSKAEATEEPTKIEEKQNIPETAEVQEEVNNDSEVSRSELDEKNDKLAELKTIERQTSRDAVAVKIPQVKNDLSMPALIDQMNNEGESLGNHTNDKKKVKRKRSFLDKLLGRNKDPKNKNQSNELKNK